MAALLIALMTLAPSTPPTPTVRKRTRYTVRNAPRK